MPTRCQIRGQLQMALNSHPIDALSAFLSVQVRPWPPFSRTYTAPRRLAFHRGVESQAEERNRDQSGRADPAERRDREEHSRAARATWCRRRSRIKFTDDEQIAFTNTLGPIVTCNKGASLKSRSTLRRIRRAATSVAFSSGISMARCSRNPFGLATLTAVGDIVIWDNSGTMHRAMLYSLDSGRMMHRTQTAGEEPIAA